MKGSLYYHITFCGLRKAFVS